MFDFPELTWARVPECIGHVLLVWSVTFTLFRSYAPAKLFDQVMRWWRPLNDDEVQLHRAAKYGQMTGRRFDPDRPNVPPEKLERMDEEEKRVALRTVERLEKRLWKKRAFQYFRECVFCQSFVVSFLIYWCVPVAFLLAGCSAMVDQYLATRAAVAESGGCAGCGKAKKQ